MDTAPFDTYAEAVEQGAYFTWANNEFMLVLITILGFAASMWALYKFVSMEKASLEHAAAKLSDKYGGSAG